ncbi:hypothetical protein [Clostridium sp. HBUAS56010]|uniref:hypothetical protein n=1 Tax=Clostridium sp. HBUAS56010 TaxID=2571127 RepID=UPI00117742E0|nr:hypothetical protein [Clostridium sp. HBUAS56010]
MNDLTFTEKEAKEFVRKNGVRTIWCDMAKNCMSAEFEIEDSNDMQDYMMRLICGNPDWVVKETSVTTFKVAKSYDNLK